MGPCFRSNTDHAGRRRVGRICIMRENSANEAALPASPRLHVPLPLQPAAKLGPRAAPCWCCPVKERLIAYHQASCPASLAARRGSRATSKLHTTHPAPSNPHPRTPALIRTPVQAAERSVPEYHPVKKRQMTPPADAFWECNYHGSFLLPLACRVRLPWVRRVDICVKGTRT
jgi:hypothetical protein